MPIKIYDLVNNYSKQSSLLLATALEEINSNKFKLKENYKEISLENFYSFIIITYQDKFFGFSGLQKRAESPFLARANTRLYTALEFRTNSLGKENARRADLPIQLQYPSAYIFLPEQLKVARSLNLKAIFISRQFPEKHRSFKAIFQKMNSQMSNENQFIFLEKIYNTCHDPNAISCWQMVMINYLCSAFSLEEFEKLFLKMTYFEWKEKFLQNSNKYSK